MLMMREVCMIVKEVGREVNNSEISDIANMTRHHFMFATSAFSTSRLHVSKSLEYKFTYIRRSSEALPSKREDLVIVVVESGRHDGWIDRARDD